ncbi:MAG: LCP family protein [Clostridiales bacterium]|nr:LCP family protein [Clostridiales bacterium]
MQGKNGKIKNEKNKKKIKKRSGVKSYIKFISIVLIILLVYVIGMGVWFGLYMKSKIDQNKEIVANEQEIALQQSLDAVSEAVASEAEKAETEIAQANILGSIPDKTFFGIYGVDQETETLSDVIIVACFDKNTRKINALSIPRDTYVTLSDGIYNEMKADGHYAPKTMKINAVHSWGAEDGDKYLTEELEEMLGIPQISYYITVNIEAFQKIVDDIGGITLDVPSDMYYSDATQDLYIDLKAGVQTLDGYNAMCLVRFRKYVNGDVDRVQVQQLFLSALLEQALSTENIIKNIDKYVETFMTYVRTNMSVADALKYTPFFPVLTTESLTMATLPGGFRDGDSGYFINSEYTAKLVDILFYDGDGNPDDYSGLSWGGTTMDSAEAVAMHEERDLDEVDNGNAIQSSIDYTELARLNDKEQYIQKVKDIIEDYPEPSDESKEVIARYIEFAASAYCYRAYYSNGDNTAKVDADSVSGLNMEVKSFTEELKELFTDAEIDLLRDVLPTARVDITGFDFDEPINIYIDENIINSLTDMDRITLLVGDNLHIIEARISDLEEIFEKYGSFTITFEETTNGNSISFKNQEGVSINELPAPIYFGFYTSVQTPACYLSTDMNVENIGGQYDGNNKVLMFSAVCPGEYIIQDVTTTYEALSDYADVKEQRITEFLTRGFMSTENLDIEDDMAVGDFMDILSKMLKKDADEVLSSLNIQKDGKLTNGQLLAACGTLLNIIKSNYYPENSDYYLGLYNINDNEDEYDPAVALAISANLVSYKGDSFRCSEDALQGDILNVLSNTYNLIEPVAVAEYNFVATEIPEELVETEETGFELNEDTIFTIVVLCLFGFVALLIIVALIAIGVKVRKDEKRAEEEEAAKEAAREAEKARLRKELYYYEHKQQSEGSKKPEEDEEYEEYEDDDEYDDEYDEEYDDDDEYYDDDEYDEEYDDDDEYDEDDEYDDEEDSSK